MHNCFNTRSGRFTKLREQMMLTRMRYRHANIVRKWLKCFKTNLFFILRCSIAFEQSRAIDNACNACFFVLSNIVIRLISLFIMQRYHGKSEPLLKLLKLADKVHLMFNAIRNKKVCQMRLKCLFLF